MQAGQPKQNGPTVGQIIVVAWSHAPAECGLEIGVQLFGDFTGGRAPEPVEMF